MASKEWTQEQREKAAKSLELRRDHPWMAESFLSKDDADNGRELLFPISVDLQCELDEARELLEHAQPAAFANMNICRDWNAKQQAWLSRNK